jgi:hypothetical protein
MAPQVGCGLFVNGYWFLVAEKRADDHAARISVRRIASSFLFQLSAFQPFSFSSDHHRFAVVSPVARPKKGLEEAPTR